MAYFYYQQDSVKYDEYYLSKKRKEIKYVKTSSRYEHRNILVNCSFSTSIKD